MMLRLLSLPVAAVLLGTLALHAAAQEPSPTATATASPTATIEKPMPLTPAPEVGELCRNPHPGRALKLALDREDLFVAVAVPLGEFVPGQGVSIDIVFVLEGHHPIGKQLSDTTGVGACLDEHIWGPQAPVVGVFSILEGTTDIAALAGWPIRLPNGQPLDAASFAGGAFAAEELLVELDGSTVTVAELLQRGRDFVEPTPTPLPPGVTLATVLPVDVGAPDTGSGAGSTGARNRDLIAALAVLAGGLALAFGAARLVYRARQ